MLVGAPACTDLEQCPKVEQIGSVLQVHIPDALKAPSGNTLAGSFEDVSVTSQDFTVDTPTVFE
jgi:hypothetical protein